MTKRIDSVGIMLSIPLFVSPFVDFAALGSVRKVLIEGRTGYVVLITAVLLLVSAVLRFYAGYVIAGLADLGILIAFRVEAGELMEKIDKRIGYHLIFSAAFLTTVYGVIKLVRKAEIKKKRKQTEYDIEDSI